MAAVKGNSGSVCYVFQCRLTHSLCSKMWKTNHRYHVHLYSDIRLSLNICINIIPPAFGLVSHLAPLHEISINILCTFLVSLIPAQNAAVEWLVHLHHTRKVTGSNLGTEAGYADRSSSWFSSVPPRKDRDSTLS
jgi:hypothetical protein